MVNVTFERAGESPFDLGARSLLRHTPSAAAIDTPYSDRDPPDGDVVFFVLTGTLRLSGADQPHDTAETSHRKPRRLCTAGLIQHETREHRGDAWLQLVRSHDRDDETGVPFDRGGVVPLKGRSHRNGVRVRRGDSLVQLNRRHACQRSLGVSARSIRDRSSSSRSRSMRGREAYCAFSFPRRRATGGVIRTTSGHVVP